MTDEDAMEIAEAAATENGWPWQPPILAIKRRRIFRSAIWVVVTNSDKRGCNVGIHIDDHDGRVLAAAFCRR